MQRSASFHHRPVLALLCTLCVLAVTLAAPGTPRAAAQTTVDFVGSLGGTVRTVAVGERYTYIGNGGALNVLDTSDRGAPTLVGSIELSSYQVVNHLALGEDTAYVALCSALQIVDVSNPAGPVARGAVPSTGCTKASAIVGTTLYIVDYNNLQIVDVGDAAAPTVRATLDIPGNPGEISMQGNIAYIASGSGGLQIVNVGNPTAPIIVGSYNPASGMITGLRVVNDRAYLVISGVGLQIVDVSNPAAPTLLGSYGDVVSSEDVDISGATAYFLNGNGLNLINIATPAAPSLVATVRTRAYPREIHLSGSNAYIASNDYGLEIVNLAANPPVVAGGYRSYGGAKDVQVVGSYAYVAALSGLQVVDISDPRQPRPHGYFATPRASGGAANAVAVVGSTAYLVDDSLLRVVNVADPAAPTAIGSVNLPNYANDIQIIGNLAYIAAGVAGLQIVDVANPAGPTLRGRYDTPGYANRVAVIGSTAYVVDGNAGLQIIDIGNPDSPMPIRDYDLPGSVRGVSLAPGTAYVVYAGGLSILNVTNPTAPLVVGQYPANGDQFRDIVMVGTFAYLASDDESLVVLDLSNPSSPQRVGGYGVADRADSLQIHGDLVLLNSFDFGLTILRDSPHLGLFVDPGSRTAALEFYRTWYLREEPNDGWNGSVDNCDAGETSSAFREALAWRINYFRAMAGVRANIRFDDGYNRKAQAAALMMSANAQLSHAPPDTWHCYSIDGAVGAASSNLYGGAYGTRAIDGYIADFGTNNSAVGHRRWLLFPPTQLMGTGDVPGAMFANALWVFDSITPRSGTAFIREAAGYVAWPPHGYVPSTVVYSRWSFSYPGADFSQARVRMTSTTTGAVAITQAPISNGYGDNTIVWEPNAVLPRPGISDLSYDIVIENVRIGNTAQPQTFSYRVTVFDPTIHVYLPMALR